MSESSHLFVAAVGCTLLIACSSAGDNPGPTGAAGRPTVNDGGGDSSSPTDEAGNSVASDSGAASAKCNADASISIERSSVAAETLPSTQDGDFATFVAHINKFGLDLNQAQSKANGFTQKNLVYSPLSATVALAMAYAGARGQTESEMRAVLGDNLVGDAFHVAANRLARSLRKYDTSRTDDNGKKHKIELNLVDSIFAERTLMLEAPFLDLLAREYDSGVRQVDFVHASEPARIEINDWVARETKDRIVDLMPPNSVDATTRIVLVNALYFYGSWRTPFAHELTTDTVFHAVSGDVQVPTMRAQMTINYTSHDQFAVAELPYEGGALRMTIVLPAPGMFESVRSQVSGAWLEQALAGITPTLLELALPKFKLTVGTFSLKTALNELGMKSAFDPSADFSGIFAGGGLYIGDVLQKSFLSVDEEGTEAAAATAVVLAGNSATVTNPIPFVVDRPFLFFIRDQTGSILFSGHVVDPSTDRVL